MTAVWIVGHHGRDRRDDEKSRSCCSFPRSGSDEWRTQNACMPPPSVKETSLTEETDFF